MMNYHLEKTIHLSVTDSHSWILKELDENNKLIGSDFIPWYYNLHFTASEFHHNYNISCEESQNVSAKSNFIENESITGILRPGIFRNEDQLEDQVSYSMLGTDRIIKNFKLIISKIDENNTNESCNIAGRIENTYEIEFKHITEEDTLLIFLDLFSNRFNKIADMITTQQVNIMTLCLGKVSGFYSKSIHSVFTSEIKILTTIKEQEVIIENNSEIQPPRLGNVGEFYIHVLRQHKVNPKLDLPITDIDKIFEREERKNSLILNQVIENKSKFEKIQVPLWIIVILLGIFLIEIMG